MLFGWHSNLLTIPVLAHAMECFTRKTQVGTINYHMVVSHSKEGSFGFTKALPAISVKQRNILLQEHWHQPTLKERHTDFYRRGSQKNYTHTHSYLQRYKQKLPKKLSGFANYTSRCMIMVNFILILLSRHHILFEIKHRLSRVCSAEWNT